jgi:hypothetical protein
MDAKPDEIEKTEAFVQEFRTAVAVHAARLLSPEVFGTFLREWTDRFLEQAWETADQKPYAFPVFLVLLHELAQCQIARSLRAGGDRSTH